MNNPDKPSGPSRGGPDNSPVEARLEDEQINRLVLEAASFLRNSLAGMEVAVTIEHTSIPVLVKIDEKSTGSASWEGGTIAHNSVSAEILRDKSQRKYDIAIRELAHSKKGWVLVNQFLDESGIKNPINREKIRARLAHLPS